MTAVRLSDVIAPTFVPLHLALKSGTVSTFWIKGGRGSTKSSFCAIEVVLGIISDPKANALCLRKVGDTVRKSLLPTLLWAINTLGLTQLFDHTKSPTEITYLPTGQKIIMTGLDDPSKLKSIKVEKGYLKILWFEELADFNGMEEIRNVRQSVVRGGEKFIVLASYNPPKDPNSWVNKECTKDIPDRMVHDSNYLDVPRHWLGEQFFKDAESLKSVDPDKYEHEYMGIATGQSERLVFHGKWEEKAFKTPPVSEIYQSRFFYGVDWGFANDPTVMTRCFIVKDLEGSDLYIDYEVGGVGVEFGELPDLFDAVPDAKMWKIYADCSRPETISYMANRGYNIAGAKKWDGSVKEGIEYIRSFRRIYIHPRCRKTIEEFKNYSYKVDKNTQDILPVLVQGFDHHCDSLRYGLSDYIRNKVSILDVL